jgi:WD40 repeat protein
MTGGGAAGAPNCGAPVTRPSLAAVDPKTSAGYGWSECGSIAPRPRSHQALYGNDGSILSLDEDGAVRAYAPDSAAPPVELIGPGKGGYQISLSNDGQKLLFDSNVYAASQPGAIGAASGSLSLLGSIDAIGTSCEPAPTPYAKAELEPLDFSADGKLVVSLGTERVCAWATTGEPVASIALSSLPATGASPWPLLVGAESGAASLIVLRASLLERYALSGELLTSFDLHAISSAGASPAAAVLSADTRTLLVLLRLPSDDLQLAAVDTQTGALRWENDMDIGSSFDPQLARSRDGYVLAVGAGVYAIEDGKQLSADKRGFDQGRASLGNLGLKKLEAGRQIGEWDETEQRLLRLYGGHATERIEALDISADGRYLASTNGYALVWELADDFSKSIPRYGGTAPDSSWNVALAPAGDAMVVSGDNVGYYRLGGDFTGSDAAVLDSNGFCLSADWAFSPNGCWVAGIRYSEQVIVHATGDFSSVTPLSTHNCRGAVAFSPDGAFLMTANRELYDTATWKQLYSFASAVRPNETNDQHSVTFSPDGEEAVITRQVDGSDPPVQVSTRYAVQSGSPLGSVPLAGQRVRYSPEGHWLVSEGRAWHSPTGAVVEFAKDAKASLFTPQGDVIAGKLDGSLVRYCRSSQ